MTERNEVRRLKVALLNEIEAALGTFAESERGSTLIFRVTRPEPKTVQVAAKDGTYLLVTIKEQL